MIHHLLIRWSRIDREILELLRIRGMIVEFDSCGTFRPFGISPAFRANAAAHHWGRKTVIGGSQDLRDSMAVPRHSRVIEERQESASREAPCLWETHRVEERGVEIHILHDPQTGLPVSRHAWNPNDQRSPRGFLEQGSFLPNSSVLPEVIPVITP